MKNTLQGLLIVSLFMACSTSSQKERASQQEEISNQLRLVDLNGNAIDFSHFKKKVIFINFWATWCAPCIKEMPSLENMQAKLASESIEFLHASNESINVIRAFRTNMRYAFNYARLDMSLESLNIYALPTTYIIDQHGNTLFAETGTRVWDSDASINKIKNILATNGL